jgi:hypothetical protein
MTARLLLSLAVLGPLAIACSGEDSKDPTEKPIVWEYPLDDQIRVNQLQLVATHNSYHVAKNANIEPLDYTHAPLDVQLRSQGVRGFELDTFWDAGSEQFLVYHLKTIDDESTCPTLVECLGLLERWSHANPAHHLLFVQIEPKDAIPVADPEQHISRFEAAILSVWPRERILAPDDVRRGAATLRQGIAASGWPTLGETRGKILFFVDDKAVFREAYTRNGQGVDGRLMFASADPATPWEGIYVINDPVADESQIASALNGGFIVRTRADADTKEARVNDTARREAAFASGAQIISTDYPAKLDGFDYFVALPGGTPSRCNPQNAPAACTSEAIETPAFIR